MIRHAAGTCLLLMTVAACGRGGQDAEATTTTSPAPTVAATTAPTTVPPPPEILYVVQAGDSLSAIATRFGVSVDDLANANAIEDVNRLSVGQELTIPATTTTMAPAPGATGSAPATSTPGGITTTTAAG